jgi:hypothetical protein
MNSQDLEIENTGNDALSFIPATVNDDNIFAWVSQLLGKVSAKDKISSLHFYFEKSVSV